MNAPSGAEQGEIFTSLRDGLRGMRRVESGKIVGICEGLALTNEPSKATRAEILDH
jgi:hypothetical protein